MIQHSGENQVFGNTSDANKINSPHISKDRYLAIEQENKLLRQEIAKLQQRCEVLHNCWQAAKQVRSQKSEVTSARSNPGGRLQDALMRAETNPISDLCFVTCDLERSEGAA